MAYARRMESGTKPDTAAAPDNMAASLRKSRLLCMNFILTAGTKARNA